MLPWVSNTPADRSPASRTTVVNEAFCRAVACSLTIEIRRFHRISNEIGSISSAVRSPESEVCPDWGVVRVIHFLDWSRGKVVMRLLVVKLVRQTLIKREMERT